MILEPFLLTMAILVPVVWIVSQWGDSEREEDDDDDDREGDRPKYPDPVPGGKGIEPKKEEEVFV